MPFPPKTRRLEPERQRETKGRTSCPSIPVLISSRPVVPACARPRLTPRRSFRTLTSVTAWASIASLLLADAPPLQTHENSTPLTKGVACCPKPSARQMSKSSADPSGSWNFAWATKRTSPDGKPDVKVHRARSFLPSVPLDRLRLVNAAVLPEKKLRKLVQRGHCDAQTQHPQRARELHNERATRGPEYPDAAQRGCV